jgi:hypothetical protein
MLNNFSKKSQESGYIALISAVIISATLMVIVFGSSFSGFLTRFNLLDSEYKERSYELAFACLNIAKLKLATDSGYLGNEIITIGTDTCQILPITMAGTVRTKAVISQAVTNLEAVLNTTDLSTTSLIEKANFP